MNAVRFYSRSGNTRMVAEAMAAAAGVDALSVDDKAAGIEEETEVLFIGGALYAYGIDDHLKDYIRGLDGKKIRKAVVFSTSWISKHALALIRKELADRGISSAEETFYVRSKPNQEQLRQAGEFARGFLK